MKLVLIRRRLVVEDIEDHKQTETTVSNKNECITKFQLTIDENSLPRFATAKRNQRYDLIRSTQLILPP